MALALVLTVPAAERELASDALWALGVLAVEERPSDGEVDSGTTDAFVELWTSLGDDPAVPIRAAEGFPARWRWRLVEVDDAVVHTWREHATPTWVTGDLVVCPAWVDPPSVAGDQPVTVVRIEPGSTFGVGDHPTTVLSLRALRSLVFPGATVLDVGCGSGVLSIAAVLLGAVRADAIDISPAVLEIVPANAALNGVTGRVQVSTTLLAELVDAATDGPDELGYDIVVANILAPTLVELAPHLVRALAPAGVLVVSGVLDERHDHVLAALAPLVPVETTTRDGWACVTLRR
jgi:ribosomal protein L11 methyltransferase